MDNDTENAISFLIIVVFIIYVAISSLHQSYRKRFRKITLERTPILLTYYVNGMNLLPVTKVRRHGLTIRSYITLNFGGADRDANILSVHLPFKTNVHLVAIAKRQDMAQFRIDVIRSVMEPVDLEGDYGDYFTLYAQKGMQMESRYVLDPLAMAFTIDFCKSHSWEIIGSEFYFVQENVPNLYGDNTEMWEDITRFIKEIKPAVTVPLTDHDRKLRNSYGSAVRHIDEILCPVCQTNLDQTVRSEVYECPNGHGTLLHGSDLIRLRKGKLELMYRDRHQNANKEAHEKQVICPSCGSAMDKVHFAGSTTVIDSCGECQFRWLDGSELVR